METQLNEKIQEFMTKQEKSKRSLNDRDDHPASPRTVLNTLASNEKMITDLLLAKKMINTSEATLQRFVSPSNEYCEESQ